MKHHIIYIPGILDDVAYVQSTFVRLWRVHGVRGHTHSMPWAGSENYSVKEQQLLQRIDKLVAKGHTVSLVGASAGATAAMNSYLARKQVVKSVVLICPKLNNVANVSSKMAKKNPAFIAALKKFEAQASNLTDEDKQSVSILLSPRDGIVPNRDSRVEGIEERHLPPLRHNAAILYAISIGFVELLPLLRQKPRST